MILSDTEKDFHRLITGSILKLISALLCAKKHSSI